MAFKVYNTIADYNADPLPLEESRVSLVKKDNYGVTIDEIKYDSVGRTTEQPLIGDVCFLDENNKIKFLVGGNSLTGSIPTGSELVGFVYHRSGYKVKILNKDNSGTMQWLTCWQYAITAISSTSITIGLRMSNNYNTATTVNITLPNTDINDTNAKVISDAIALKATQVGDTRVWWAYYDHTITVGDKIYIRDSYNDATGSEVDAPCCWTNGTSNHVYTKTESVEAKGESAASDSNTAFSGSSTGSATASDIIAITNNNRIIVQTDSNSHYQQANVTGVGCTIALCVWEDMPANYMLLRKNMLNDSMGILNVQKGIEVYGVSGTTPTSDVSVRTSNLVKRACFEDPSNSGYTHCAALRTEYGTYENYIKANKVKYPQRYGVFNLIDTVEMTRRYGNSVAVKKNGDTIYKFPPIHTCAMINYNANGLRSGSWNLLDITDGVELLDDNTMSIIQKAQLKMGVAQINNSTAYWFARRGRNNYIWGYNGTYGYLFNWNNASNSYTVLSVCTLDLTQINQSNNS